MHCLILEGDEQTAAVAGFVNIEYHFLHFVLILKDGRHLPFFLRSLTLPARPRLNDFRWALLRTEIAQPPYYAQLRRFCRFGYTLVTSGGADKLPCVKQLQDDSCLRNLLRLHTQGTCQVTFFLEQCQTSRWIPKGDVHSIPEHGGLEKVAMSTERKMFDQYPSSLDSLNSCETESSTDGTQRMPPPSWSSSSEVHQTTSRIRSNSISDFTEFSCHYNSASMSLPMLVQQEERNAPPVWPTGSIRNFHYPERFWAAAAANGNVSFFEYFAPVYYYVPGYPQSYWYNPQWGPNFSRIS